MRLAQVGLGFGVGLPGKFLDNRSSPGQVRVLFFLTRNARQLPLPESPVRSLKPFDTKNPSAATNKGRTMSKNCYKHRLPQARCLFGPLVSARLLQQRAGLRYFANSQP